jgi:tetratricopeptide (TPR) repeat protein
MYSQENVHELTFENHSVRDIDFYIFPVSMVFNGFNDALQTGFQYNLFAMNPSENPPNPIYDYINGRNNSSYYFRINRNGAEVGLNHDRFGTLGSSKACIGYGIYKVHVSWPNGFDTCTVEWDAGYPFQTDTMNWSQDLSIIVRDIGGGPKVLFQWGNSVNETPIDDVGKRIVAWDQQYDTQNRRLLRNKQFGSFKYDNSSNNPYTEIPLDCRTDCAPGQGTDNSNRSGLLRLNMVIDKNIFTREFLNDAPTIIAVDKFASLKIAPNRIFEMITPFGAGELAYTNLVVSDSAFLILYSGSKIIVDAPNKLTLKNLSNLTLSLNSQIIFKPGSTFCNEGGRIWGKGSIIFEKGIHGFPCDLESPMLIQDSCRILVSDSSELVLPDNFTLHLKGKETALILNPGSKLLFGENSGIVCDSGARLIANDATFASADSTKKWNGISLNDLASDTIKNCTIKNAMYGIMISDRYDPEESPEPYSAEISDCSFVNQTSYVLNNAVYLQNSAHVLLKDNTITSNNLSVGFTHGIYAEYCPGEMLNIINNNISNCNNGMTVIQSSPYIAFNTLDGNSNGESGMFLDNSNGTIKYNVISDFYNSYYSFYSSPDLLKNTFDNSCDDNVYLSSSSVPVMHPLQSGGSVYWYAGDNHVTGSPYDAGILFDEDAYPDMNYGYNRFTLTGSNYYLNGVNPSASGREFYVYENYWGQTPPDSLMFNITGADVKFNPYDNNSQSARLTNTFDKTDIGFGLMDTVHILESDNPNSAQELYLLAYQSEFNREYEAAIGYYKEIVSDYKDSSSASSCLARIFNCYEKKQATAAEYALLKSYYSTITEDTSHTIIMRNISEDLAIQSNIKQGNIEEAISDYDEIYANNTNTQKGFHALINKEILSAGSGDNLSSGNSFDEIEFKQIKINALLKGFNAKDENAVMPTKSIPQNFNLSQNYPNPFNPSTKISYELRVAGYIVLRVFDALGKEVVTLVNEVKNAGRHEVEFKADNLPSGVYFYSLSAEGKQIGVKRMALVK